MPTHGVEGCGRSSGGQVWVARPGGMFVWEGWRRGLFAGDRHCSPPAWAPAPAQLDGSCPVLKGNIGGPAPKATDFPRHFLYLIAAVTSGRESASVMKFRLQSFPRPRLSSHPGFVLLAPRVSRGSGRAVSKGKEICEVKQNGREGLARARAQSGPQESQMSEQRDTRGARD